VTELAWSVVVPTYERPRALERCLAALRRLEAPPGGYEIVVVDDGSRERPTAVVDGVGARLVEQSHAGPGAARNRGVMVARGRFVAMTDDDCAPEPDWLRHLHDALADDRSSLVGGTTTNAVAGDAYATASELIVRAAADYTAASGDALLLPSNNLAAARDDFLRVGGFDSAYRVGAEDRDLCDRWAASGRSLRIAPQAVVRHYHAMDLGEFWRVHSAYGRGARRYHRQRRARGTGRLGDDALRHPRFLAALGRRLRGRRPAEIAALAPLVALAQVATVAGYVTAPKPVETGNVPERYV
jgi:GT2 family glycosyltransferase